MFCFDELDDTTRQYMLQEFRAEQSSVDLPPFRPANLSPAGEAVFVEAMERAIVKGNEETLIEELDNPAYWIEAELYKKGTRHYSPAVRARRFAITDFNTWYIRGLTRRLMQEGVEFCEVYRADSAYVPRSECRALEGQRLPVRQVYDGHRAKYYPINNPNAFSIPVGPNCHHSVRRLGTQGP